jgi:hypothetical protein
MSPIVCSFKLQQSGDSRTELCEEDMGAVQQLIWVQNLCTSCWTQKKSTKVEHTLCPLNLVNNIVQDNKLRENIGFSSR